jgi:hypothetical protein
MNPLTLANVESELSYAYLHAIASHCQCSCSVGTRHEDNAGVDAKLTSWGPFDGGGYRTEVDLKIQLKATVSTPSVVGDCYSYSLRGIPQYNDLRSDAIATPRILVVLYLPRERTEWIAHSEDALTLRRCAYWVSLRGAPESTNDTGQTVYIPKSQKFDCAGLSGLLNRVARGDIPTYAGGGE